MPGAAWVSGGGLPWIVFAGCRALDGGFGGRVIDKVDGYRTSIKVGLIWQGTGAMYDTRCGEPLLFCPRPRSLQVSKRGRSIQEGETKPRKVRTRR